MKLQHNRPSSCTNLLNSGTTRLALATATLLGLTSLTSLHAQINGTIGGSSVTRIIGDDSITTTTIGIDYFTFCPWIPTAVSNDNFTANNFVFAGQGVASSIPNIAS